MHHRSFFLSQESFQPRLDTHVCVIETNYFIPRGYVGWFKNPIPSPDTFEEGNISNISPTIKIDILVKLEIFEENTLDTTFSTKEISIYKSLFRSSETLFPSHTHKFLD
jgi:hypothetical protein